METLKKELKEKNNKLNKMIPFPIKNYMVKVTNDLREKGYNKNPLNVGDKIPDGVLINHLGENVSLYTFLNSSPAIISFYRGAWCPYCNLELKHYDELLKEDNRDVLMIAISPEKADITMKTIDIEKLNFKVFSDIDNKFAKKLKLIFKMPKALQNFYRLMGININKSQGNIDGELPIPATYIIDSNMVIKNAWIDVDYTKRAEPSEVLEKYRLIANNK